LPGLSDTPAIADIAARVTASAADQSKGYVYDGDGRELFCVDATGAVTQWSYDANGNVVREARYANPIPANTALTQAAISAALVASADDRVTRTVYDAANRAVYDIDALSFVTQNVYDANGNLTQSTRYAKAISVPATLTAGPVRNAVAAANAGSVDEGIAAYLYASQPPAPPAPYRLPIPPPGDTSYTLSAAERDTAVANGARDLGVAGYTFATQAAGTTALYRLFNPTSGDHFYTTSAAERDDAVT